MKNWAALTIAAFLIMVPVTVRTDPSVHPVGTTLITEGSDGRVIEVTQDREIVWEYISPYLWDSSAPTTRNLVYRAYRVPYDWVPQLPKPKEAAVDPGPNYLFLVPAADGSKPDIGIGNTSIWKQ